MARISIIVAAAENGSTLAGLLAADPYARAIMLLHGLHPRGVEERLRETLLQMRTKCERLRREVHLLSAGPAAAKVRIHRNGSGEPAELLVREVESILVNAAPDLDDIVIEVDDGRRERRRRPLSGGTKGGGSKHNGVGAAP